MCKKCKAMKKKQQHKFFKRVRLSLGLVAGGAIGMLFAPKKGREMRGYFTSEEFKAGVKRAQTRAEEAKEYVQDKAFVAKSRFERFLIAVRKRFGM